MRITARPQPPDVKQSHQGFKMDTGSLTPEQVNLALDTVHQAFEELPPPTVITNRHYADSVNALELGEFPTLFFHPQPDDPRLNQVESLRKGQQDVGIYGVGEEAGKTVFGAVAFPPRDAAGQVVSDPTHANGLLAKGGVSFVFKPEVLGFSTFAPYDFGWKAYQHGSREDLEKVALGRILRNHQVVEDRHSTLAFEDVNEATPKRFFEILQSDPQTRVAAFKKELSDYHDYTLQSKPVPGGWPSYPPMVEAEMRAPRMEDVQMIVLEPRRADFNAKIPEDLKTRLLEGARQRGIPVVDRTQSLLGPS